MPTPIAASTIVAQAFRFIEATPPSSFDDDTEKAQAAKEQYPEALAQCLEASDWSFASTMALLAQAALPAFAIADADLPYFYTLPGDLIRLHEVGDAGTRWRRDAIGLRADEAAPLRIRYTANVTTESRMPATFRVAVSLQLALLLGPRWLTTAAKMQALQAQAQQTLRQAMREDARMASSARYDGLDDQGDWATEVLR